MVEGTYRESAVINSAPNELSIIFVCRQRNAVYPGGPFSGAKPVDIGPASTGYPGILLPAVTVPALWRAVPLPGQKD